MQSRRRWFESCSDSILCDLFGSVTKFSHPNRKSNPVPNPNRVCYLYPNLDCLANPTLDHCFKLSGGHHNRIRVRLPFKICMLYLVIQEIFDGPLLVAVKTCWKYFLYCSVSYVSVCTFRLH